jgi:polar amino acid transport system substrate-binding protein
MTVFLSVVSMPLAVVIGLAVALGRLYGPALLRLPLAVYVEVIRGTPLLLQLLFLHYGLIPLLGLPEGLRDYAPVVTAVTGLALNYAAYEAEIYRAGLLAIPVGQTEAALALGLTRRQAIWHIVVPQAVRLVIPPVTNDFINLFKDTAVCSVIAVEELSKRYNIAVNNAPRAFAELALVTAALYLAMSYPLSLLTRRLERRQQQARA